MLSHTSSTDVSSSLSKWLDIVAHSLYPIHPFSGTAGEAQDRKREGAWLATTTIIARRSEDALLRITSQIGPVILPRWFRLATLFAEASPSSFGAIGARLPLVAATSPDLTCGRRLEQGTVTQKLVLWRQLPESANIEYTSLRWLLSALG